MRIGTPVDSLAPDLSLKHGKVWQAVKELALGEWLPVECDTPEEASALYSSARSHRTMKMRVKRRKLTVYLQLDMTTDRLGEGEL